MEEPTVDLAATDTTPTAASEFPLSDELLSKLEAASAPYLGQWTKLISTTNWDKGKIIYQWRTSLQEAGAPTSEYADDAWARRVGGVTGQHVGRLRRVFERFGDNYPTYDGLFWSHFQAAIEWDDAEMWLEGAAENKWSVSSMRNQRWETMGKLESDRPDDDIVATDVDEDYEPAQGSDGEVRGSIGEMDGPSGPLHEGPDFGDEEQDTHAREAGQLGEGEIGDSSEAPSLIKPFAEIGSMPDDVLDAFEAFKLAIIRHRGAGWEEISREDMISCLESLKVLVNAPSGEPEKAKKPTVEGEQPAPF
ncbi:hypothetical protein C5Y96_13015 [Blastopirellula marina]|uniref:Uncharacterized protein n=1 Tax=Blastopirellula marina TaxID=124 RepID=A0A2S8FGG8_9BACT|nr:MULTISPECIES: hypothetical protein [Pirellulaceae]PQO31259.1 hypothetical protein C5Y96_13015 [Blastopirellula marina]RCS51653.1 hypothetical protein DTL36_13025 [Bremerella cremea]